MGAVEEDEELESPSLLRELVGVRHDYGSVVVADGVRPAHRSGSRGTRVAGLRGCRHGRCGGSGKRTGLWRRCPIRFFTGERSGNSAMVLVSATGGERGWLAS
jgi:hypothetical protein